MDFQPSEMQKMLDDSVQRFVTEIYTFDKRRELLASDLGYSDENWRQFAELGWLGLPFAEAYGGFDGQAEDLQVLMRAFGRGLVLEPYLGAIVLGGGAVAAAGNAAQCQALLPDLIAGEKRLALAYAEPGARYELNRVAAAATRDGQGYRLNGHKGVVLHGPAADTLVVSARTGGDIADHDGISLFLVPVNSNGVSLRGYRTIDGQCAAEVLLQDVPLDGDALLGSEGTALPVLEQVIDAGIVALCAEAVGCMEALNELTVDYLKTRKQFGTVIGSFQALQHRAVDMFMALEQARSLALLAAAKADAPADERRRAVSAAKQFIGQAARHISHEAVQLHGGMGMTDELPVSHYYKRLTAIDITFGDSDYHLDRFAEASAVS